MLRESRWTLAGESTDCVHTQKLTVMLFSGAFVQIFAALAVLLQYVTPWTGAHVSSLDVLTDEVAWFRSLSTLIHINTDGAGNVGGVSGVTDALVGALCVHTSSVLTQIPHHLTLINILSVGGVSRTKWAHFFVLGRSRKRTDLTV